jgi:hypothetical protein
MTPIFGIKAVKSYVSHHGRTYAKISICELRSVAILYASMCIQNLFTLNINLRSIIISFFIPVFILSLTVFIPSISLFLLISKNLKIKIYKTVILPVVLYGCETWSLTLREEHRLRVFDNRVLRRIFGPKREEDGSWRKLHNDELHNLYSSPYIVRVVKARKMRWPDI